MDAVLVINQWDVGTLPVAIMTGVGEVVQLCVLNFVSVSDSMHQWTLKAHSIAVSLLTRRWSFVSAARSSFGMEFKTSLLFEVNLCSQKPPLWHRDLVFLINSLACLTDCTDFSPSSTSKILRMKSATGLPKVFLYWSAMVLRAKLAHYGDEVAPSNQTVIQNSTGSSALDSPTTETSEDYIVPRRP